MAISMVKNDRLAIPGSLIITELLKLLRELVEGDKRRLKAQASKGEAVLKGEHGAEICCVRPGQLNVGQSGFCGGP